MPKGAGGRSRRRPQSILEEHTLGSSSSNGQDGAGDGSGARVPEEGGSSGVAVAIATSAGLLHAQPEDEPILRSPSPGTTTGGPSLIADNATLSPNTRRSKIKDYLKRQTKVFGVSLEEAVLRSRLPDNLELPAVFRRCIMYVEAYGLQLEGVYRLPGQKSRIEKLRALFDSTADVDLAGTLHRHQPDDINVAASLLKLFLRELPDPLLTEQLLPDFATLVHIESVEERSRALRSLLCQLPMPNYMVLGWLTRHLAHVAAHSEENKMTLPNLFIVFGPTIRVSQNLLSHFLEHTDELFPDVQLVADIRTLLAPAGSHASAAGSSSPGEAAPAAGARKARLRMSRLLAPGNSANNRHSRGSAGGPDSLGTAGKSPSSLPASALSATTAPDSLAEAEPSEPSAAMQHYLKRVAHLEKDVDALRKEVAQAAANGQTAPSDRMELLLAAQRQLTAAKRRLKELRRQLGIADVSGSASTRNALAASLNQLYCGLLLKHWELLAIRERLFLRRKEEEAKRRQLETQLRELRADASSLRRSFSRQLGNSLDSSTGENTSVMLAGGLSTVPPATAAAEASTLAGADDGRLQAILQQLEAAKAMLTAEQDALKAQRSTLVEQRSASLEQCADRRVELNLLWIERHPLRNTDADPSGTAANGNHSPTSGPHDGGGAALVAASSSSASAAGGGATPSQNLFRRPGTIINSSVPGASPGRLRSGKPPASASGTESSAAEDGQSRNVEDENWAHVFHGRHWTYRAAEARLPLNRICGPGPQRHIAAAEPPSRPASLVDWQPLPRKAQLADSNRAWDPRHVRALLTGSPVMADSAAFGAAQGRPAKASPSAGAAVTSSDAGAYPRLDVDHDQALAHSAGSDTLASSEMRAQTSADSCSLTSPLSLPVTPGGLHLPAPLIRSPSAAFAFDDLRLESPSPLSSDDELEQEYAADPDDPVSQAVLAFMARSAPRGGEEVDSNVGELTASGSAALGFSTASGAEAGAGDEDEEEEEDDDDVPAWKKEIQRVTPPVNSEKTKWRIVSTHDAPAYNLSSDEEEGDV